MRSFGENLKIFRELRGIGQVELAKHLGITQGMVSMYERHCRKPPSIKALENIAKELHCSVEDLIGDEEEARKTVLIRSLKGLSPKQMDLILDIIAEFKKSGK